jgi:hypothetical protein
MDDRVFGFIVQAAAILYVVVRIFRAVWSRVREKRQLGELGMRATVKAEKLRWKDNERSRSDES